MKMEQCSEKPAYKIQTPGNYLEEGIQQLTTNIHAFASVGSYEADDIQEIKGPCRAPGPALKS
jgi:hypothetical protein